MLRFAGSAGPSGSPVRGAGREGGETAGPKGQAAIGPRTAARAGAQTGGSGQ